MQEGDGAELRVGTGARTGALERGAAGAQQDAKHGAGEPRVVRQEGAGGRKGRIRFGRESTHWRTGSGGRTWSVRWAATSTMRRALQEGQTPRPLQEKATRRRRVHGAEGAPAGGALEWRGESGRRVCGGRNQRAARGGTSTAPAPSCGAPGPTVSRRTREDRVPHCPGCRPEAHRYRGTLAGGHATRSGCYWGLGLLLILGGLPKSLRWTALLAAGVLFLVAAGLFACIVPVRRALRIQPIEALRSEG